MKITLTILSALFFCSAAIQAQNTPSTAWRGLQQEQKALKDAIVLGAQLTEGDAGQVWDFQLLDTNYKSDRRIVTWSRGTLSADSAGSLKAFERGDLIPLGSVNLNASVSPIRSNTQQLLEDAGKKAARIQYALSRREGQEQPEWKVTCLGGSDERLAVIRFNAESCQLVHVDLNPGNPTVKEVEKETKSFGKKVEKTFKGIGGDLEEFFTGKRSVDKE